MPTFMVAILSYLFVKFLHSFKRSRKSFRRSTKYSYHKHAVKAVKENKKQAIIIETVQRDIEQIDRSKNNINKRKNVKTIILNFNKIFECLNRLKGYEKELPAIMNGLEIYEKGILTKKPKPTLAEIERLYLKEKERILSEYILNEVNRLIKNAMTLKGKSDKSNLLIKALVIINDGKPELRDNINIEELVDKEKEIKEYIFIIRNTCHNKSILNDKNISNPPKIINKSKDGKIKKRDRAYYAWASNNISAMLNDLKHKTNPIDRHYLLRDIVEQAYKVRDEDDMRQKCKDIAEIHIREFPRIAPILKRHKRKVGGNVYVPTFEKYAIILTEDGDFEKAIEVCKTAISFNLNDRSKSGYKGRIDRIRKRMELSKRNLMKKA